MLPVNEDEKRAFEALAPDAEHLYAGRSTVTPEQLSRATILLGWPRAEAMQYAKNLKWFHVMFVGTEAYEQPGILPEGIIMTNSAGANRISVAEHLLTMLLAVCRKFPLYATAQQDRRWSDYGPMKTIRGGTVLVLGAGNIGSTFAGMCQALGAKTVGLKRTVRGPVSGFDEVYPMDQLDALLPQADVVALTLPHTPETIGILNAQRIALMKDDAILLNAGRGSAVDQDALVAAMRGGKLWGAGLDVTVPEPLPEDSPLWDVPNLLLTPHVAGGMRLELTRKTTVDMALDNLRRYLNGEPLKNRVN
jgi:phosphoglycerate dehydrogenase-like enzyme